VKAVQATEAQGATARAGRKAAEAGLGVREPERVREPARVLEAERVLEVARERAASACSEPASSGAGDPALARLPSR
jgi:hypothetical protein